MMNSGPKRNKASHGDGYYIAAAPPFRSRACWRRYVGGMELDEIPYSLCRTA